MMKRRTNKKTQRSTTRYPMLSKSKQLQEHLPPLWLKRYYPPPNQYVNSSDYHATNFVSLHIPNPQTEYMTHCNDKCLAMTNRSLSHLRMNTGGLLNLQGLAHKHTFREQNTLCTLTCPNGRLWLQSNNWNVAYRLLLHGRNCFNLWFSLLQKQFANKEEDPQRTSRTISRSHTITILSTPWMTLYGLILNYNRWH